MEDPYDVPASPVTSSHMLLRHLDPTHSSQQLVSETTGGGSITAFPVIETQGGDLRLNIPVQ